MTKESGSYSLSADILYINKKLQFSYTYNNIPRSVLETGVKFTTELPC